MGNEYGTPRENRAGRDGERNVPDRTALHVLTLVLVLLVAGCDATPAPRETWDACFIQKAKIGYVHTTSRDDERDGRALRRIDSHLRMAVQRFGQSSQQDMRLTSWETPDGEVVAFESETAFGSAPKIVSGQIVGTQMVITDAAAGQTTRLPWKKDIRGFFGIEESLNHSPMQPGEQRTLQALQPVFNQVADVELFARDMEDTSLLAGSDRLLRIESTIRMPGAPPMEGTYWTDLRGNIVKSKTLELECYRTTRAIAKATGGKPIDLGFDLFVKPQPPLKAGHATRRARYLVELKEGDPAEEFATGATQQTTSTGPHTAEIVVVESMPDAPGEALADEPPATEDDLRRSSLVESDDPTIVAMAAEAAAGHTDPVVVAKALEAYVHRAVTTKGFSQVFATAAEVAKSREGDCTEHAVLLAALARAKGIPARAALGLVYVEDQQAFGFHMWTEVFLNGRWVPLDATLGRGGIGAAHLKLGQSSLDGAAAYSSFLPVWRVLGQLKIKVLEQE